MDVVAFDDHVAQVDANTELDPQIIWFISVAFRQAFLDINSALDRIDNTRKLDQQSVSGGFDDAAPEARDGRLDQFVEMGVEPIARPSLVFAHQPRITRHVGSEYCGEAALDGHSTSLRQAGFA
jgi:hypothetical protein